MQKGNPVLGDTHDQHDGKAVETDQSTRPQASPPSEGPRQTVRVILRRFLAVSLFYKILIANSLIVLAGAIAGTTITIHVAIQAGLSTSVLPLALMFSIAGVVLTAALNALVLRAAFTPLNRLQDVAFRVRQGDLSTRVEPSLLADRKLTQLAETLNQILDEVQAYEDEVRALSGRVIRAQEEERQRISRELHDDTGQIMTLLLVRLKLLEARADTEQLKNELADLRMLVAGAIDRVRQQALNLRPPVLDQLGLVPAIRSLVETYTTTTHIAVHTEITDRTPGLSPERTIAIYRVAQEALTNVAKHAGAHNVDLRLRMENNDLCLTIRDDGYGFDAANMLHSRQRTGPQRAGVGLFGMEERARLAGGTLSITSAPGQGTSVTLRVPAGARERAVEYEAATTTNEP